MCSGAGPQQSLKSPLGIGGEALHDQLVRARHVKQTHGGEAFYSNTLKYSSNRYTRPHLLPVISRKMPTCSKAAMSL